MTDEDRALLDSLAAQYGEIAPFEVPGFGLVVIKSPEFGDFDRLVDKLAKSDKNTSASSAMREFALSCVVHPERSKAKEILQKKPALVAKLGARAQELAGADIEELGKD